MLAAGVRPWRHLTHLVLTRTDALHLAAHRPSHLRSALLAPRLEAQVKHREREREAQRVESLQAEIAQLRAEVSVLTERAHRMTRHLKQFERDFSQRSGTIEGRVEVLERYGSGAGGSGMDLVWRGTGKIVKGVVCTAFPFMESWFEDQDGIGRKCRARGKAAKRLRGVNNLPPVPEVDETKVHGLNTGNQNLAGAHVSSKHEREQVGGVGVRVASAMTWPLRFMREVVVGGFKIVRG